MDRELNFPDSKEYIGGGVYIDFDPISRVIHLTNENGIAIMDRIILEPEYIKHILAYTKRHNIET